MNSREKLLASSVVLLIAMMIGYFVWSNVQETLDQRHAQLANLRQQREQQDRTLLKASRATRQLADLQQRALPENREQANALYQRWLLDLVDQLKFIDPAVTAAEQRARGGFFDRLRFDVNAEMTMRQLSEFLGEFYAVGSLHRIQQMSVRPRDNSRRLDVTISIEVLSLPNGEGIQIAAIPGHHFEPDALVQAQQTVLQRSMFFPENVPPQLEAIPDQRVVRGQSLQLPITATDGDPWDTLEFALGDTSLSDLKLQSQGTGEATLQWKPSDVGEFAVQVLVRDDGLPSRSDVASFKITVVEPPPPPPVEAPDPRRILGFDDATQTVLVGTVARGEYRQAWFNVRTRGEMLRLQVGDTLQVGSIRASLSKIDDQAIELSTDEGVRQVRLGQSLAEGVPMETAGL
jgi:hypothetical protein